MSPNTAGNNVPYVTEDNTKQHTKAIYRSTEERTACHPTMYKSTLLTLSS